MNIKQVIKTFIVSKQQLLWQTMEQPTTKKLNRKEK